MSRSITIFGVVIVLTAAASVGVAPAQPAEPTPTPYFTLELQSQDAAGQPIPGGYVHFQVNPEDCNWYPQFKRYRWVPAGPITFVNQNTGATIAVLDQAEVRMDYGNLPRIEINIGLRAGDQEVVAVLRSGELAPPPPMQVDNSGSLSAGSFTVESRAQATVGLTDLNGDGAEVNPLNPDSAGLFYGYANGLEGVGTTLASLVGEISCGPGGDMMVTQAMPPSDYGPIDFPVKSTGTQLGFVLSPEDCLEAATMQRLRYVFVD